MGKSCDPLNKRLNQATSGRETPVIRNNGVHCTAETHCNKAQWKSTTKLVTPLIYTITHAHAHARKFATRYTTHARYTTHDTRTLHDTRHTHATRHMHVTHARKPMGLITLFEHFGNNYKQSKKQSKTKQK